MQQGGGKLKKIKAKPYYGMSSVIMSAAKYPVFDKTVKYEILQSLTLLQNDRTL